MNTFFFFSPINDELEFGPICILIKSEFLKIPNHHVRKKFVQNLKYETKKWHHLLEDGVCGQFSHTTQPGEYQERLHLPRSHSNQNIHQSAVLSGIHTPEIGKHEYGLKNKQPFPQIPRICVYKIHLQNKVNIDIKYGTAYVNQSTLINSHKIQWTNWQTLKAQAMHWEEPSCTALASFPVVFGACDYWAKNDFSLRYVSSLSTLGIVPAQVTKESQPGRSQPSTAGQLRQSPRVGTLLYPVWMLAPIFYKARQTDISSQTKAGTQRDINRFSSPPAAGLGERKTKAFLNSQVPWNASKNPLYRTHAECWGHTSDYRVPLEEVLS